KGVCYLLQDGAIKLAFLPYSVVKAIRELQNDPEWAFDSFPMPRKLNIRAIGAGTKEVEYNVLPSLKESPVSDSVLSELAKKKTPEQIVEAMKEKRAPKAPERTKYDTEEADRAANEIPF
ncbi:MAG: hypothetical protein KGJ90_02025, partial [Patescibacteria group bacterium]|nr:hypothetical protein [Patescibacteria group bacterium]